MPLWLVLLLPSQTRGDESIDKLVEESRQAWGVPGCTVVVIKEGEVFSLKGYGVRKAGSDKPVTPTTLFPIASCTKAFTTLLIAKLADEKKLGWDDRVHTHLPKFKLVNAEADEKVTLRDLCSHRTGLGSHDFLWYRAAWPIDEAIERTCKLPPEGKFRAAMQYQSVMVMAAGRAAEKAGGKPWADQVADQIAKPLGLKGLCLTHGEFAKRPDRASGHYPEPDGTPKPSPDYAMNEANPAGSAALDGETLARWLRFWANSGDLGGTRIIPADAVKELWTPQVGIPLEGLAGKEHPNTKRMGYGLGWVAQDYRGEQIVSHAGIIDGFRAHVAVLPSKRMAVGVLANLHATRFNLAASNRILDGLLGAEKFDWDRHYLKLEAEQAEEAVAAARAKFAGVAGRPPSLAEVAYAGTFSHPAYGSIVLAVRPGGLVMTWGDWRLRLVHVGGDTFAVENDRLAGEAVEAFVDQNKVVGYKFLGRGFKK